MTLHKTKKVILTTFMAFVFLFISFIITLFILGPEFLEAESNAQASDAIILLSSSEERMERAIDLYHDGKANKIILTNSTEHWTKKETVADRGVDEQDLIEEPKATSTFENATLSEEIMKEHNFSSAIVVTSDYHSRRTKMTFDGVYSNDIQLSYSFAESFFNPEDGLTERESETVFTEYVKMIAYWPRLLFV
ncbi:YdcF family protein [Halobacillus sp. BBL2006]|uniref:YdcF family protein n=1 Tax=Halobacillus sp. BBL2006 TaxID=1543706 RepID=UPI00068F6149|nr:YdcF family protein [Halobacillus sp. BBL2006]